MQIVPLIQLKKRRQELHLNQNEIAALLGLADASVVSRHEAGLHAPDLRTAIAYQVIYGRTLDKLFPDAFDEVAADIAARASAFAATLRRIPQDQRVNAVLRKLAELTGDETIAYGENTLW
jgi:transcriptional regulator with XRE-family HTH domain